MTRPPTQRWRLISGWLAVALNLAAACLWAFWGAIEMFHEGWFETTLMANLAGAMPYLVPMTIFVLLGALAVRWPIVGGLTYVAVGLALGGWFISTRHSMSGTALVLPVLMGGAGGGLGVLFMLGRAAPRRWALRVTIALPILVALLSAAEPIHRVATRHDDGDRGLRVVQGNGVRLAWAPAGPGWPREPMRYDEALRRASHLTADGLTLSEQLQHIWRLPTIDEAVRSLTRGGLNAGGTWDPVTQRATYASRPDKESPLWDPHTPIIYWWTASEIDDTHVWRIVYNGLAVKFPKRLAMGSQSFRAVREARPDDPPPSN